MNRHTRRSNDASVRRTGTVSPALLQAHLKKLAEDHSQAMAMLTAIVKQQGRVRVARETLRSINDGDSIKPRDLGDEIVLEFVASNMVTPHGVTNGQGNPPKESA